MEVADYYASVDIMAVVFDIDSETATGRPPTPNDYIAGLMKDHPQQFIGFGSVDPWKGQAAVKEAKRCAELGLKGLKFMPNMQQFFPNDERFYPSGRQRKASASSPSSTPARPASAPDAPVAAESS